MKTLKFAFPLLMVLALSSCSPSDETTSTPNLPSSSPSSLGDNPAPGSLPDFAPLNYDFVYSIRCYCPVTGPFFAEVREGQVQLVKLLDRPDGSQSKEVPAFAKITIQEMIEEANMIDPQVGDIFLSWPEGQEYPSELGLDFIANAADDEVFYTIEEVQLVG